MARHCLPTIKSISLTHLPTLMLALGYLIYWLELFAIPMPEGRTSWLAWVIFLCCAFIIILNKTRSQGKYVFDRWMIVATLLMGLYLIIAFYASIFPIHLEQEYDTLNYHLSVPRQHLITASFAHLPWSTADLFLLSLDYALAPFSLATTYPNKVAFFIVFLGLFAVINNLVRFLSKDNQFSRGLWAVVAVLASHMVMIQAGTAMFDIVIAYCFFACWHSLVRGKWLMAGVEGGFLLSAKSFLLPQLLILLTVVALLMLVFKRFGFKVDLMGLNENRLYQRFLLVLLSVFLILAGPQLIKSFYYTGTPLYPFGVGVFKPVVDYAPEHWQAIVDNAKRCVQTIDAYGYGKGLVDFVKHFWLIAVPDKGVNNAFDYPVGLVYLLLLGVTVKYVRDDLQHKVVNMGVIFIVLWWLSWWFGSQQTRFLLIPMLMMIVFSLSRINVITAVLKMSLLFAICIELISLINTHKVDWGKRFETVLRPKDQVLIRMNNHVGILEYHEPDIAYAPVEVNVTQSNSVFVINRGQD